MNPNICESPEHSFPSSCVSEPSRNEINMKLTHAAWQLRPLGVPEPLYFPKPTGSWALACRTQRCFPRVRADLHLIWPPVLPILLFSEFQNLHVHSLYGGCAGHSRNFRAEQGKARTTRWQSHTQVSQMMLFDRLAYKGSPSQHTMVQRLSHSFTVWKTDSKWLSVFIWAMFQTTGCVNIWIWCSWAFELVSFNS